MHDESRYVRLARIMHTVLERARVPLYFSKYSKHTYTVWQHMTLLAIRQYEFKSYRRFDEFLNEASGLVKFLKLSKIPHFTALNKFALRISNKLLEWVLARFITLSNVRKLFIGIDASGFKPGHASQYFFERMRGGVKKHVKGYVKLSIGVELREQLICSLKIRRSPKHDTVDFKNVISKSATIKQLSIVVADKGYDSEGNHEFVRERMNALSIIPTKFQHVPIERMHGRYRKEMKQCFHKELYNQRNKNETVLSVIKRMFGEYITSRRARAQNRELAFRCIAYNMNRCERIIFVIIRGFLHSQNSSNARHFLTIILQ